MYRNKKDVDKHVENLISKLSVKEFKTRAYSVARLYYEVGDYASCQKYVEQYLTQKDNNAAAYKLLGQALQKLEQKEKALEQYKTSLDIDPTQTSTILDICELLVADDMTIDPGHARYWCEKAEAIFPRHPVTFRLREKLVTVTNPNPEALVELLTSELAVRPKDALLHARLLKHYLQTNQVKEALTHSCNVEFSGKIFRNNYAWYETLAELLKHNSHNFNDWLVQLLLLTVRERMCVLSLSETSSSQHSLIEINELLFLYDQDIENVTKAGGAVGFGDFHNTLLQHHRGQLAFHAATFLLKKAKKDQMSWREATQFAAPLMLFAWHTLPNDTKMNWLANAPEKQQHAAHRWYLEGSYRCSQSGHYLIANSQDKSQLFIDRISQICSGTHWRDKIYEKIFTSRSQLTKIKSSHFVTHKAFSEPILRLPRRSEVFIFDNEAQMEYANSLHHYVWILLNYKDIAQFKCNIFNTLTPSASNCGPESMNKIDIHAFLYCATLTSRQQKSKISYISADKPSVIPANITDLLCSLAQMKWWDCAYKFSQNELGTELTDVRTTLSKGIEVVRCIDHHGLDTELLCKLGKIFSEKANLTTAVEEKNNLELRAKLYYLSAIPLLETLKRKTVIKLPEKRIFDYTHKELTAKELNSLIEESKLFIAVNYINEYEYDKAIELLTSLKSPEALYHLSQTYKKVALEENSQKDKCIALLMKARNIAYKSMDNLKHSEINKNNPLLSDTVELIEELDVHINKIDIDLSASVTNDVDGKYSSDENISLVENEHIRTNHAIFRNLSSTPKAPPIANITNYRTAVDSQILENSRVDHRYLERIETEIKKLQKRETTIDDFMEQTKKWFDENRKLGNEIISTIHSNIQSTIDQFKLLKISVDHVKDQISECRNECKDVGELKKQIAEMKKEINKLKKAPSDQNINESDLYNLEDEYRTNDATSNFPTQLPFAAQMLPQFNQRLVPPFPVPPNPYQLYGQNLYNLYTQYSQFGQSPQVPGAPPIFDPTRSQMNYPGVYPTPETMYLDVAQLVPPMPAAPSVSTVTPTPVVPSLPTVSSIPTVSSVSVAAPIASVTNSKPFAKIDSKDIQRSLPVNVVITSSDPLPTYTSTPAPVLSVTIPSKHIKNTPHNYQIPMPTTNESKIISPPFSLPTSENKPLNAETSLSNWEQYTAITNTANDSLQSSSQTERIFENSKSVVDGILSNSFNTSGNKSRTLSEKSNTSVDYDPCPDFKPIIPLPAEVKVTTGEEDETVIFSSRAKLFRFVDKQWKERGLGEMKLLKHKTTGKVRVLMRREQIHKICANHIITPDIEIKPMKNETKAYFWVANDFADEKLVLEKFCIRFKTADVAKQFYEKFEEARIESGSPNSSIQEKYQEKQSNALKLTEQNKNPIKANISNNTPLGNKSGFTFGGLTFSSTPTFKTEVTDTKIEPKSTELTPPKLNVFSGLTFKTNNSSSFSNIFATSITQTVGVTNSSTPQETTSKLNTSDTVEEFEPNVDFKPVVPLPALVEQKTGEEDENVLFEHRAKLLRFDSATKEWKERGLGNIKLLVHKDNVQKVRLLMRREQIMKVCCNHALTKDIPFQKMPNMDKAVTWCAKDFSDAELVTETFCLRFKSVQACDAFMEAVKSAQLKMKDDTKTSKEEQNAAKQSTEVGFGDKFKPKPGAWSCDTCYTNNLENFDKCACCEQPKPQTADKSAISTSNNAGSISTTIHAVPKPHPSWGDAFKPKSGSWECKECLIRNDVTSDKCVACNSPKDPTAVKSASNTISTEPIKFNFGIPSQNINNIQPTVTVPTATTNVSTVKPVLTTTRNDSTKFKFGIPSQDINNIQAPKATVPVVTAGWGDKFKPQEGSWECKLCCIRNEADSVNCKACTSPKDTNVNQKDTVSNSDTINAGPKFNFGLGTISSSNTEATQKSSIFDGTGAHKFRFGIQTTPQNNSASVITFGNQTASNNVIFATPKAPENQSILNLNLKKNEIGDVTITSNASVTGSNSGTTFGVKKGGDTFDFVFKPKTPSKGKSPVKSPKTQKDDESDDNEYASEDEGHHIHFSPVIPLPDKVQVVTGEENESELYSYRAKLFRFVSPEWKERGIGVVKILKHKETGKLRIVMRREQVLKICLNHALTSEIMYTPKDDKSWLFAANDFSEGELNLHQFCLRFKTKEIATEFKDAIEKARGNEMEPSTKIGSTLKQGNDNDDVVFVTEIQATTEEKETAKKLMLPENFFTYKVKEPCQGCRGCDADDNEKSNTSGVPAAVTTVSTPIKTTTGTIQSPANSLYRTPSCFDKTADESIFRTPLGSLGSNTKSTTPVSTTSTPSNSDSTDKENTFIQRPSDISEQKTIFSTPLMKPTNTFDLSDAATPTTTKVSGILAPPKLSAINKSENEKPNADPKSIFGAGQNIQIFSKNNPGFGGFSTGTSMNKSIFGGSSDNKPKDEAKPEVKSIFGVDNEKPINLFSGIGQGSLFGPGALGNNQSKPTGSLLFGANNNFGSKTGQTEVFGNGSSIFGSKQPFGSENNKPDVTKTVADDKKDTPLNIDSNLSFATLSTSGSGFNIQKKPDFKWEGAGQQLFTSAQNKKETGDKSANDSNAGNDDNAGAEEDYDPHYEPIVPLPDKIVVTTGEEDEEKIFGERCKLYRYEDKTREWKERGVGELKILYHPERKTYRLLLRREQVHKAVLNMLLFMDLELLPMKNTDRAWTWAGHNYAESNTGEQETLAVRFKTVELAASFRDKVVECVRKLQAAAAQALREEKDDPAKPINVPQLRLPKHLQENSRVDNAMIERTEHTIQSSSETTPKTDTKSNGEVAENRVAEMFRQAHLQEPVVEEGHDEDDEEDGYEHDYEQNEEDYDGYYNEEEDESAAYYTCEGEATVKQGAASSKCEHAQIQVLYDQDIYSPKILVTDADTGEILADMLIHTDTEFQMTGTSCSWSGTDYTSNEAIDKTVTINFHDDETAMQFYDSCETSKAATYSSTDPES